MSEPFSPLIKENDHFAENTLLLKTKQNAGESSDRDLDMRIISDVTGFDALEESWTNLVERSSAYVFQTWEWNRTWWKYFGENRQLQIVTFYSQEELVGIAPMFRDRVKLAGVTVCTFLRFIGSNVMQSKSGKTLGLISYTDYLDVIVSPGYESSVCHNLFVHFQEIRKTTDAILLESIPERSTICYHLLPIVRKENVSHKIELCDPSQMININRTWNEYLKSLKKNRRYKARLHWKRAHTKEKKVFDVVEPANREEAIGYFEQMVKMHQEKWNRYKALGTFFEEANYRFHKKITRTFYDKGWLQFKVTKPVDDPENCVAIDLNYLFKDRLYGVHTATDDQSDFYRFGPGTVMLNVTLEEAMKSSLKVYDFLRGDEAYKLSISDESFQNRTIRLEAFSRVKKWKGRLAKGVIYLMRRLRRKWELFKMIWKRESFGKGVQMLYRSFF